DGDATRPSLDDVEAVHRPGELCLVARLGPSRHGPRYRGERDAHRPRGSVHGQSRRARLLWGAACERERYGSQRKSTTALTAKTSAPTIVRRVRFRSTMCVPPCDCGVNPIPPSPVSRPECIRIRPTRAIETSTWKTESTCSIGAQG